MLMFGQNFKVKVLWGCWCLGGILKSMLGRDSENESLSRFVQEIVIWTQPSGPLCLWQCFHYIIELLNLKFTFDNFAPVSINNWWESPSELFAKWGVRDMARRWMFYNFGPKWIKISSLKSIWDIYSRTKK